MVGFYLKLVQPPAKHHTHLIKTFNYDNCRILLFVKSCLFVFLHQLPLLSLNTSFSLLVKFSSPESKGHHAQAFKKEFTRIAAGNFLESELCMNLPVEGRMTMPNNAHLIPQNL